MSEDIIKVFVSIMVVIVIAVLFILFGVNIQRTSPPIDIGFSFIIGGIVGIILVIIAIIALLKR